MINQTLLSALQNQLTMERQNAAIYDALAAGLDAMNWPGSSTFMKKSADEERTHADKFAGYIVDRNETPIYSALDGCNIPQSEDLIEYFQAALNREMVTTEAIKTLHYQCEDVEDPQTEMFLIWFLDEQTKSEREITDILLMLRRLDKNGMLVFDNELKG